MSIGKFFQHTHFIYLHAQSLVRASESFFFFFSVLLNFSVTMLIFCLEIYAVVTGGCLNPLL